MKLIQPLVKNGVWKMYLKDGTKKLKRLSKVNKATINGCLFYERKIMWKIIIEGFKEAYQMNLVYVVWFEIVLAGLYLINMALGTLLGSLEEGFDVKKFLFGLLKYLAILVSVFIFCFMVNFFTIGLNKLPSIQISVELVTTLEVIAIIIAWCVDLTKDIVEKIKSVKTLKHITYSDVKVVDYNISTDQADEVIDEEVEGEG